MPGQAGGLRGHVVHAREDEGVPATLHHDMPVVQRFPAQLRHPVEPALGLPGVLVVPRDVDLGQPGPDRPERRGLLPALAGGAVGDVAGVDHDVRVERVDRLGDPRRPGRPVDRPVVGVGQHDDTDPVQATAEPRDADVQSLHPGHPHGLVVAPGQQPGRDQGDGRGHDPGPAGATDVEPDQHEVHQPAQHRPGEQHPDHPEAGVRDASGPVQAPWSVARDHQQRERDQPGGEDDRARQEDGERPVDAGGEQRPPRREAQNQEDEDEDGQSPAQRSPRRRVLARDPARDLGRDPGTRPRRRPGRRPGAGHDGLRPLVVRPRPRLRPDGFTACHCAAPHVRCPYHPAHDGRGNVRGPSPLRGPAVPPPRTFNGTCSGFGAGSGRTSGAGPYPRGRENTGSAEGPGRAGRSGGSIRLVAVVAYPGHGPCAQPPP